eukprot:TRINITY_DN18240_c0_g1_i1.p1 TRINITY_DN18240_c0_g1~~TRINITY_DN18240_c0_g1_i1.p1  ORF type:complete len:417 (-),score=73.06 TRINITY_DN18240_c0_g1_i1:639-1835(-)
MGELGSMVVSMASCTMSLETLPVCAAVGSASDDISRSCEAVLRSLSKRRHLPQDLPSTLTWEGRRCSWEGSEQSRIRLVSGAVSSSSWGTEGEREKEVQERLLAGSPATAGRQAGGHEPVPFRLPGKSSSGGLRARGAPCGCQAEAAGSSGEAASVGDSQAFPKGKAPESGPDMDDAQASRGEGDAGPAVGGGSSGRALHCTLALASLSAAFWGSSSSSLLRQLLGRALAALQRTQLPQMLFRLLVRGPYGIFLLLGCVLTALVTSLWRHFKEADEIWNSLPCELCDCRGIERCHVCQGRGEILWEGKLYHTDPCPRCLGKKIIKCRRCEGQCLRKKAGASLASAAVSRPRAAAAAASPPPAPAALPGKAGRSPPPSFSFRFFQRGRPAAPPTSSRQS